MAAEDRWPPIHDFEGLIEYIDELAKTDALAAKFWSMGDLQDQRLPSPCHGDVLELSAPIPVIADDGEPALTDDRSHWLVIGNSCDSDRDMSDGREWTQIVPLADLGDASELGKSKLAQLKQYDAYRGFYVPPWPGGDDRHRLANFMQPVTLHRGAIGSHAKVVARMQRQSWVLLHACLIRFYARSDGRHD